MSHVEDLAATIDIEPGTRVSRLALSADGVRIVVFAFDAGTELTEHTAPGPILLQALSGQLEVTVEGSPVTLNPGGVLHIAGRVPHAVRAIEPSKMALTLIRATG